MDRFLNAVKAHAGALDRGQGQPRFATVASVDPARYAARVSLQPEGVLTGWVSDHRTRRSIRASSPAFAPDRW